MPRGKDKRRPQHLKQDPGRRSRPARPMRSSAANGYKPRHTADTVVHKAPEERHDAASRNTVLFEQSLLPTIERVHQIDQRALRAGVIWLLLLPVLLAVIRLLTDSSKVAFLIIWIIGMFILSAALIFVAYADHQLKAFLADARQYVPAAADTELDGLLPDSSRIDLPAAPEILRGMIARGKERRESGAQTGRSADQAAHPHPAGEQPACPEERGRKEAAHAEHSAHHTR